MMGYKLPLDLGGSQQSLSRQQVVGVKGGQIILQNLILVATIKGSRTKDKINVKWLQST